MQESMIARLTPYILFAIIIALFYGNTLGNGFVYDDVTFISQNEVIQKVSNIPKILTGCLTDNSFGNCKQEGVYYHPFLFLQFLFNYQISHSAWFFHLVNLILFFIDAVLVFWLLKALIGKGYWPIVGTLIFLTVPINSEIGNFASTVNDHYLLIFFILSFLAYIRLVKTKKIKYLFLSSVCFFLALAAKETAIFLFIVIIIYEALFKKFRTLRGKSPKYLLVVAYIVPIVLYFLLRIAVFGRLVHPLKGYHDLNFYSQILTSIAIYPLYLIKLIYPLPLNAQHDPPVITSLDWRFFAALIFWICNIALVYFWFRKKFKLAVLGYSLIFLSILPVLIFINKIGRFILAERYLYLATVGFVLILIDILQKLIAGIGPKRAKVARKTLLIVFVIFTVASWLVVFKRNGDWHDELTFNRSIAKYSKTNDGVFYNLGVNYSGINQYKLASESYQRALAINPNFWQAHNNLANAYLNLGEVSKAQGEYQQVLLIDPQSAPAEKALSNLLLIKSGTESAKLKLVGNNIEYKGNKLTFSYPVVWSFEESNSQLVIKNSEGSLTIQIAQYWKPDYLSADNYLEEQSDLEGVLVNRGLAQIPGFDKAYVKVWREPIKPMKTDLADKVTLQFFLFKGDTVVKVLVSGIQPSSMGGFDYVLSSIRVSQSQSEKSK